MSQSEQRYFTERKLRKIAGLSSPKKQLQAFDRLKTGRKIKAHERSDAP
jgi:hypothetical protein